MVVVCGRVWAHVAGCGGMWQGVGAGADVCGTRSALWHRWAHVAVVGTYGRVLGHVAGVWGHMVGYGGMWQGLGTCAKGGCRVWGMW